MIVTSGCRNVRSSHMVRHGVLGEVKVSPDGARVTWDGEPVGGPPTDLVTLSRLHYW